MGSSNSVDLINSFLHRKEYAKVIDFLTASGKSSPFFPLSNEKLIILSFCHMKEKNYFEAIKLIEESERIFLSPTKDGMLKSMTRQLLLGTNKLNLLEEFSLTDLVLLKQYPVVKNVTDLKRLQIFCTVEEIFTLNKKVDVLRKGRLPETNTDEERFLEKFNGKFGIDQLTLRNRESVQAQSDSEKRSDSNQQVELKDRIGTEIDNSRKEIEFLNDELDSLLNSEPQSNKYLHYLVKNGINQNIILKYLIRKEDDLCYWLVCKELFIKYGNIDWYIASDESRINDLNIPDKTTICNELLIFLDDWDVYKYALTNKLALQEKTHLNYLFYDFLSVCDQIASQDGHSESRVTFHEFRSKYLKLLTKLKIVEQIDEIYQKYTSNLQYFGQQENMGQEPDRKDEIGILNLYLNGDISELYSAFLDSIGNSSPENERNHENSIQLLFKLLLSLLIGSKKPNNIFLALYLLMHHGECNCFRSNYEFQLIHIFILKYFRFSSEILAKFESLQIRDIQLINLSHLVLDHEYAGANINIFRRERSNMISEVIECINFSISRFHSHGQLDTSHSLLRLKEKLLAILAVESKKMGPDQDIENEIQTDNEMFINILGKNCRWFFSRNNPGYSLRIRSKRDSSESSSESCDNLNDLLENEYERSLIDDQTLEEYIEKMAKSQNESH